MKDLHALRARLRHAGLRPASEIAKPHPKAALLPADWPGQPVSGPDGNYFLAEYRYGPDVRPGDQGLLDFLPFSPLPDFLEIPRETDLGKMVFMDTETTGLAGGTGTLAFLIGTGTTVDGTFVVRQYFLADPSAEGGMLVAALQEMEAGSALVTFNGRGFDVPILQTRASLRLRRFDALAQTPHWDLLPHARRLWKRRLESCALRSLEIELLGVHRSTEDVPSSMIPYLYREYLRSGDPRLIAGVLYHNVQDILSMAYLAARVLDRYTRPVAEIDDPLEVLSLAYVYRALGRIENAESAFRTAVQIGLDPENRNRALEGLAGMLKARGDSAAGVEFWEAWVASAPDDPRPSIELAKYYEWRMGDPSKAVEWTERAASAAANLPAGVRRRDAERDAAHRLTRLQRKMNHRAVSPSATPKISRRKRRGNPHPAKSG
jgi:uncharacterized protein YprB with RNaseH-like and TPR domain